MVAEVLRLITLMEVSRPVAVVEAHRLRTVAVAVGADAEWAVKVTFDSAIKHA
jgi:hypothetical protein